MSRHSYEIPVAEMLPLLPEGDRARLIGHHERVSSVFREVWDETENKIVAKLIPLDTPRCNWCDEEWGKWGCTTIRALAVIAGHERLAKENSRRISELTEALTPRFGVGRLRDPGNRVVELHMKIDEYTIIHGGMGVVVATLRQMYREFANWFKKSGDLARVRSDHAYALTLDSSYYTYLTQEFDAAASFEKPQHAPWATAPWDTPDAKAVAP